MRARHLLIAVLVFAGCGGTTAVAVDHHPPPPTAADQGYGRALQTLVDAHTIWDGTRLWNAVTDMQTAAAKARWDGEVARQQLAEINRANTRKATTTTTTPKTGNPVTRTEDPGPVVSGPGCEGAHPDASVATAIACWFPHNTASATRVANCESSLDPGNVSPGGGNWGLFQINTAHKGSFPGVTGVTWASGVLNAWYNAQFAAWLYASSGWGPWACRWAA